MKPVREMVMKHLCCFRVQDDGSTMNLLFVGKDIQHRFYFEFGKVFRCEAIQDTIHVSEVQRTLFHSVLDCDSVQFFQRNVPHLGKVVSDGKRHAGNFFVRECYFIDNRDVCARYRRGNSLGEVVVVLAWTSINESRKDMVFRRCEVLNGCDVDIWLKIACLADGFCEVRCHSRERCAFKALVILFINIVAWRDIGAVEIDGNTRQEQIARLGNGLHCERGMFKEVRKGCFQGVDEFVSKFADCHNHNVSSLFFGLV